MLVAQIYNLNKSELEITERQLSMSNEYSQGAGIRNVFAYE